MADVFLRYYRNHSHRLFIAGNRHMSDQNIKQLLAQLHEELEKADQVDAETLELVHELDGEIHRLVDPDSESDDLEGVVDRANAIETRFAVEHPRAERFLREIMDALSKVGI